MAKIQKVKSYTYKNTDTYKYRLNIPSSVLSSLKWKEGMEIEFNINGNKLEISKK